MDKDAIVRIIEVMKPFSAIEARRRTMRWPPGPAHKTTQQGTSRYRS